MRRAFRRALVLLAFSALPACAELKEAPTATIDPSAPTPPRGGGRNKVSTGPVTLVPDGPDAGGTSDSRDAGSDLPSPDRAAAVYAGPTHACALLESGAVQCWG